MSSGLLKKKYTTVTQTQSWVIDSNASADRAVENVIRKMNASPEQPMAEDEEGFVGFMPDNYENIAVDDEDGTVIKNSESDVMSQEDILENARMNAESIVEEAKREAETIKSDTLMECSNLLEQAKADGLAWAEAELKKRMSELEAEYDQKCRSIDDLYDSIVSETEPKLVDTITSVYEHIFNVDLQNYREILLFLITKTIRNNNSGHDFLVHVSKEDYPFVSMHKKELAAIVSVNSSFELTEDMSLGKNECKIETDLGIFDCGLSTQLEELSRKLKLLSYES